jgi:hypothetical protein
VAVHTDEGWHGEMRRWRTSSAVGKSSGTGARVGRQQGAGAGAKATGKALELRSTSREEWRGRVGHDGEVRRRRMETGEENCHAQMDMKEK